MRIIVLAALLSAAPLGCGSSNPATSGAKDAGHPDSSGAHDAASASDAHVQDAASSHDAGHANDAPTSQDATSDGAPTGCTVVTTANGPVEGATSGATCTYQGIPYAAPPTGALRWTPPQPAASWTAPRPSAPAAGCAQVASNFGTASSSEDCLYLNVWAPASASSSPRPVMVFVHGGSFLYGSGTFPLYDATNLATATGSIVVTLNYRLGALGFLSNPALRAEDPTFATAGDYGLLDQIAALEWVKTNIAAFGGSASNVTIFGESAGGTSMFVHLVAPKSKGLFQQVIVESGAAVHGNVSIPQATADALGGDFATSMGCTDSATLLTCLRALPIATILAAESGSDGAASWWPVTDGVVIPDEPMSLFASGSFTKVPTLVGNNENEGTLFLYQSPPTDAASYQALAEAGWPGQGAAIVAEYPVSNYAGSYFQAAADVETDAVFLCPTRKIARAIAMSGTPTFRYDFDHAITFPIPNLGAFHGSELMFVFGNKLAGLVSLQAEELPLSNEMMGYWGSMAAHGTPNSGDGGAFVWPPYELTTEPEILLDLTLSTETELKKAQCDFWDSIGY
jgi:para-nitrobenzyl esterase